MSEYCSNKWNSNGSRGTTLASLRVLSFFLCLFASFFLSFFLSFLFSFFLSFFLPTFFLSLTLVLSHSCFHSVLLFISWKSPVSVTWHRIHWHKFTDFWSNIFNYREKSVNFHQSTRRHIPQDSNPYPHRSQNLKSVTDLFLSSILHSSFRTLFLKFFPYLCFFCLYLLFLRLTTISGLYWIGKDVEGSIWILAWFGGPIYVRA